MHTCIQTRIHTYIRPIIDSNCPAVSHVYAMVSFFLCVCRSGKKLFRTDHGLISAINEAQSFWTAGKYPQFENLTMDDMINLAGGKQSRLLKWVYQWTASSCIASDREDLRFLVRLGVRSESCAIEVTYNGSMQGHYSLPQVTRSFTFTDQSASRVCVLK